MTLLLLLWINLFPIIQDEIMWFGPEQIMPNAEKPYFIKVYAKWCGWCKKLDKTTFLEPEVITTLNEHFIPIHLDGESDTKINVDGQVFQTRDFLKHIQIEGYPTLVMIDKNGAISEISPGYKTDKQLLRMLRKHME